MIAPIRRSVLRIAFVSGASILFAAAYVSLAFAQAPKSTAPAKGSAPAKKTEVNFEDQLVEGQTQKPELFYLLQQRNNNFKRLIKLRENFLPEMRKTSEDISRKGSGS